MASTETKNGPSEDTKARYEDPFRQSSVIPYRISDQGMEIMMITSIRRKRWILPKGIVEPDMTPFDSAAKEALEEAGVEGKVSSKCLGRYHYEKWGGTCRCDVFALLVTKVHKTWLENDERDREWVPYKIALKRIRHKKLRAIVEDFISKKVN